MYFTGIDLHSTNSVVSIINDQGQLVAERRLPNDLCQILGMLSPWASGIVSIAVESTYNWYWLVDGLVAAGFKVALAHVPAIKQYSGLKHGNDETDARHLAQLLRLGILPTGAILPPAERAVRDLARKRQQLVRSRVAHMLAIENISARHCGKRVSSKQARRLTDEAVQELGLPAEVALAIQANAAVIRTLDEQIRLLEGALSERLDPQPGYQLLTTMPGVGKILAATILLETGPLDRFAKVGNFASYARCVDSSRLSNGKKKGEGNRRNGNKYLAWAFVEAAHFCVRYCPQAKRFYERKKAKTNTAVATKALAHKLARACFYMLKTGEPFDTARCFA